MTRDQQAGTVPSRQQVQALKAAGARGHIYSNELTGHHAAGPVTAVCMHAHAAGAAEPHHT